MLTPDIFHKHVLNREQESNQERGLLFSKRGPTVFPSAMYNSTNIALWTEKMEDAVGTSLVNNTIAVEARGCNLLFIDICLLSRVIKRERYEC